MTTPAEFLDALAGAGVRHVSGVPCSYFAGPLRLIDDHPALTYTPAANEGGALALAVGAQLAGTPSAVLVQNSGFGNLINPLTSLALPYRVPVLVIMSMRGWPHATAGEPQHQIMGRVVHDWLHTLDLPFWELTAGGAAFADLLTQAGPVLADHRPAFILVGKDAIDTGRAPKRAAPPAGITGEDLAREICSQLPGGNPILATTGYLSRALLGTGDRPEHFYMQGSMGHVISVALGVALQNPHQKVVVLDGDGAALMHLGALAVVGGAQPPNLIHVVFDNGGYESTGGQPAPGRVDFCAVARACGYRTTLTVADESDLSVGVKQALTAPGPVLLTVHGVTGRAGTAPRASETLAVAELAARFRAALAPSRPARGDLCRPGVEEDR
ncbi:phosphonopyruvate decarboxylase [Plantactinospora sp. WMMB334]|uniref:phosphonopyruvate decarboxylase n=1 Tax=Plantactinospora sp. WMMB334 TaxID=3404119 RepID=UPI003B930DDD